MLLKEKLENLPTNPGVYIYKNSVGKIIYIGKAKVLRNRIKSYFVSTDKKDPKTQVLVSKIADVETIVTDTEVEALILEANLIYKHKPRYNILLKDDSNFPYVKITNEIYPKIQVTRNLVKDGSKYFGPYPNRNAMFAQLSIVKKLFKTRACEHKFDEKYLAKMNVPVCLEFHLNKCFGHCQGLISVEDDQNNFKKITKFLNGHTKDLLETMKEEMNNAAKSLSFEKAAKIRDQLILLENYSSRQKVVINDFVDRDFVSVAVENEDACGVIFQVRAGKLLGRIYYYLANAENQTNSEIVSQVLEQYYLKADFVPQEVVVSDEFEDSEIFEKWLCEKRGSKAKVVFPKIGDKIKLIEMAHKNAELLLQELKVKQLTSKDFTPKSVASLQRDLRLKNPPKRIECFDISNIQGTDSVASMVVFLNAKPLKKDYRKFKIQTVEGTNDFASIFEVVTRRYKRLLEENKPFPDLIMVDGGKGQLSSAVKALQELGIANQPIIGLAKRLEEVFIPESNEAQNIPKTSSALKLLQQVRDEAHRFAITFHRDLREKRMLKSDLDEINGIGPRKKAILLKTFGSVRKIRETSVEELAKVPGITVQLAEEVLRSLKENFKN
ncbi:excinuclease ABC subunit C [bacterium]|nr:excinuclease ABC subunit C [bacterium]